MPKRTSRREEKNQNVPIKRVCICSVIGAVLYFIEITAFSAAELHLSLGAETYLPAGLVAAFVSSFIAGFIALIKDKKKAMPLGALAGALQAVISDIVLVAVNSGEVGKGLVFNTVLSVAGAVIGAVVAANVKSKIRY